MEDVFAWLHGCLRQCPYHQYLMTNDMDDGINVHVIFINGVDGDSDNNNTNCIK